MMAKRRQDKDEHQDQISHHGVLAPVGQAVVHCDLLALGNISDCDDHQPHLGPTVDFSYTTVGRRMEEDRSSNATCSFLAQLWHTVGEKKQKQKRLEFLEELTNLSKTWVGMVSSPELSGIREVVGASRRREAVFCTFWILAITWKRANYFKNIRSASSQSSHLTF